MKESEAKMIGFMEDTNKCYVVLAYKGKYDWKLGNCRQLYDDLKKPLKTTEKDISLTSSCHLWFLYEEQEKIKYSLIG